MLTPYQIVDGWLPHDGGPCPVPLDSRPVYMMRDGKVNHSQRAPAATLI